MRLWRLSSLRFAEAVDGGYGLVANGRWNTIGHPVTYASTVPSLCVLEKLVHIEAPALMPPMTMVAYRAPDEISQETIERSRLPKGDWQANEDLTQSIGDDWLTSARSALLFVPSAIVSIEDAPDRNVLINPRSPQAASIEIERIEPFKLDVRLFGRR